MIDKININPVPDPRQVGDNAQVGQKNTLKPDVNDTLQIDFGNLIEQAINTPPADNDAVQKAKELLETGRLDSAANIREAAENIIKFGI